MAQAILKKKPKWESTVSARLRKANADQIWPLLKDFFGVHKYLPNLPVSYGIEGVNGEVGSIRYCGGTDRDKWAKEKLVAVDSNRRCLSYEIIDGNIGFNSYAATIKVSPPPAVSGGGGGCVLECSFSADPVEGFGFEGLVQAYQVWLKLMAEKMEDSLVMNRS